MSWSGWSARLNVTSIVSQGLEQVSKLKEDVEKQFDQAVQGAKATSAINSSDGAYAASATSGAASDPDVFGGSSSQFESREASDSPPGGVSSPQSPSPVLKTVDDINVIKPTQWGEFAASTARQVEQPPYSADGKRRPNAGPPVDFFTAYIPQTSATNDAAVKTPMTPENEHMRDENVAQVAVDRTVPPSGGSAVVESNGSMAKEGRSESDRPVSSVATEAAAGDMEEDEIDGSVERKLAEKGEEGKSIVEAVNGTVVDPAASGDKDQIVSEEGVASATGDGDIETEDDAESFEAASRVAGEDTLGVDRVVDADVSPSEAVDAQDSAVRTPGSESRDATITAREKEIVCLRQQLQAREDQLMSTSSTIQELHDELDKTCHREVTAVERARFLTEQLELMRHEVTKLNRMAADQRDSDLHAMQHALSDKDEKLKALLEEGQALSIKQAQFEQRVRQLRKEKNEEEEMRLKVESQYEAITIQFQDQSAKLKAIEEDNKKYVQQLRQLQTAADTAINQLTKSEHDVATYEKQAEQLKVEVEQLSQSNSEMQQELATMKETTHSHAALSSEKSELEQTIHFLHQNLRDLEEDSIRREEMARAEILDLKRKWQDAVSRVDMMGQSVSEATQPLLRQIHSLQEDQRARQETWKATEATLLQRIQEGGALRREVEADKLQKEEEIHCLQSQIESLEKEVKRRASELTRERERSESSLAHERELQAQLDGVQTEIDEWRAKFHAEVHAKDQLLLRLNNERNKKADLQADSARETELEEAKAREAQLRHDLEWNQNEVRRLKTLALKSASSLGGGNTFSPMGSSSGHRASFDESSSTPVSSETQASILKQTLETAADDSFMGSTSVLGFSQLQQKLRLREGENRLVKQQLSTLEAKQAQLTEEIVRLSTRNALLETNETQFQQTQEELLELKQRQHVLLELFGEKEEQVEELQSEVSELKAFYRKQLDTLAKHQVQ